MKKIVSLIVLVAVLVWTWSLINGARSGSAETHAGIQERMRELIAMTIKEKRPTAEGLEIDKLWTESTGAKQIQAHFSYKFLDKSESGEIVETSVEGDATLNKQDTDNPQLEQWALTQVKISNDQLVFQEGIIITPSKPLELKEPTPQTETAAPANPTPTIPVTTPKDTTKNQNNKATVAPNATGTTK